MENGTGEGTALKIVSLLVEKARGEWLSNNSAEHSHSLRAFISESNNFFFQPKKVTRPGSAGWLMAQSFRDRSNGKGKQLSTGNRRTLTVG